MRYSEIEKIEIADRLSRMSDDVLLTTEEAATFLRMSASTLSKLRCSFHGSGPTYIQNCVAGAQGPNSTVRYRLGDLKAWIQANAVTSTFHAAGKKGLL